jgi:hypothetical protein
MPEPATPPAANFEPLLHLLDQDPLAYLSFGVYWWSLKRLLRESGYERYYLGASDDPPVRVRINALVGRDPASLLAVAAHHHRTKCEWGERYDGGSTFPDESGDTYTLRDPDFGPAATA